MGSKTLTLVVRWALHLTTAPDEVHQSGCPTPDPFTLGAVFVACHFSPRHPLAYTAGTSRLQASRQGTQPPPITKPPPFLLPACPKPAAVLPVGSHLNSRGPCLSLSYRDYHAVRHGELPTCIHFAELCDYSYNLPYRYSLVFVHKATRRY